MEWISIHDAEPEEGQDVIVGHVSGWVWDSTCRFLDGIFRSRKNAECGGVAGFKQKDTKKPNGDPAGPDEWLDSAEVKPTHWQPLPSCPLPSDNANSYSEWKAKRHS